MAMESESKNTNEKKVSTRRSRSTLGFIYLGCFLLVLGYLRFSEYKTTGQVSHERFGFTESGPAALIPILALTVAGATSFLIALIMFIRRYTKRGEYSEIDEAPEFVICIDCGEPQRSKELVAGHCHKCTGSVESLEGYYDRHPELKPVSQTPPLQKNLQTTTFITCTKCGKSFYYEDCPESLCQDCRTTRVECPTRE
jgi:hypothetical protein